MVGKLIPQEMATSAIIREISDSNLETGKYGPKSGVSQIIWGSLQHCCLWVSCGSHVTLFTEERSLYIYMFFDAINYLLLTFNSW